MTKASDDLLQFALNDPVQLIQSLDSESIRQRTREGVQTDHALRQLLKIVETAERRPEKKGN